MLNAPKIVGLVAGLVLKLNGRHADIAHILLSTRLLD
jgi:hypothetical protein